MAKKSNNTQGNPYHDESNGQFTTKDGESTSVLKSDAPKIKLKQGVDFNAIFQAAKNHELDLSPIGEKPTSLLDAERQGNRILGFNNIVGYADNTDLNAAYDFNKALYDVVNKFPKLFTDNQMYLYGTKTEEIQVMIIIKR